VDDPKSESFSVLARAGLKVARGFLMLAIPKSTVDDASAEQRARISAVFLATAPVRHGVDASYIASIEGVVRKPMASGPQALRAAA
jgi:high-affinity nickel permease